MNFLSFYHVLKEFFLMYQRREQFALCNTLTVMCLFCIPDSEMLSLISSMVSLREGDRRLIGDKVIYWDVTLNSNRCLKGRQRGGSRSFLKQ